MRQKTLGRTGLTISELCLGTINCGWRIDQETAFAIFDRFYQAGGNFFQAAGVPPALSMFDWAEQPEAQLGRWLRARKIDRERCVISTRVVFGGTAAGLAGPEAAIRQAVEGALRRLQTSYLDLLVFEWSDALWPIDEVLGVVTNLVRAGMLRYCGVSNFPVWRVADAIGTASRRGTVRPESIQADYSLLDHSPMELDAMDLARECRLAFLAKSPMAGGALASPSLLHGLPSSERQCRLQARYANERNQRIIGELLSLSQQRGAPPAQVALAWVLSKHEVAAPVIGVTTLRQLDDAIAATGLVFSSDETSRLDAAVYRSIPQRMGRIYPARTVPAYQPPAMPVTLAGHN